MRRAVAEYRSFDGAVRLLLLNQLTINIGFYMLMPYLADHLSSGLGLAAWLVGVVLGVRNLSQQGMFFLGGALADRFGYRPLIIAGCALRTAGFGLLAAVDTLPALIAASAATGFAGALFNPAVRAYLAHASGERRVEAFALFNTFYQAGILVGPLIGLALTGVDFRLTAGVAAALFLGLTALQVRSLAPCGPHEPASTFAAGWRTALSNRPFLLFSLVMVGSYVLSFQVYLALPLEIHRVGGGTAGVAALFAASGLTAVLAQVRITAWCKRRLSPAGSIAAGLGLMAAAFALLVAVNGTVPTVAAGVLLTLGTLVAYPFEMDTVVALSGGQLVATHYGVYNTLAGIGITIGNLGAGALLDLGAAADARWLSWTPLAVLGIGCSAALLALARTGRLDTAPIR